MIKVILKNATNGIIKKIVDDNYSGSGNYFTETKLYEIDSIGENSAFQAYSFLMDLIQDLNINTGDQYGPEALSIKSDWGAEYMPSITEINEKIAFLKAEIKGLKSLEQKIKSIANG